MLSRRIRLFSLFGFSVYLDLSWFIVAALVTWSLAVGIFPFYFRGLSAATYWLMGVCGALGLFFSIVFHELAHSLLARMRGMQMRGITLFVFGGVAEMVDEPPDPMSEFLVAIIGPIASFSLAAILFALQICFYWAAPVEGVLGYIVWINAMLALFNLTPAFPLDGGRVLRAALWAWKKDLRWATRLVSWTGVGFGILLVALGLFTLLTGNVIGGLWWGMLGIFLQRAAKISYEQLVMRQALEGKPVRSFLQGDPVTVSPGMSVQHFADYYIRQHRHKLFPVVNNGELLGGVGLNQIINLPRAEWPNRIVAEVMMHCSEENTIKADADAVQALARMNRGRLSRLFVVDGPKRLAGVLALGDLLDFLSLPARAEKA
jgi:Zn-dependent protease/CBS domain-containing protein